MLERRWSRGNFVCVVLDGEHGQITEAARLRDWRGRDRRGQGMIVNSSRGVIFASKDADFAEAARRETEKLRDTINRCREKGGRP